MHPMLEEMARAREVQPHALYRWWSTLHAYVTALEAERDQARAELEALTIVVTHAKPKGRAS